MNNHPVLGCFLTVIIAWLIVLALAMGAIELAELVADLIGWALS